ncbi:MAG TPA: hypothetical protein VFS00_12555 [Polyangiaceae bacterium]|nr:hypothetical protein [Polyangiaceae bacterium]
MATTPPNTPAADEPGVEYVDDPDLEAALDEAEVEAGEPAEEVFAALDETIARP